MISAAELSKKGALVNNFSRQLECFLLAMDRFKAREILDLAAHEMSPLDLLDLVICKALESIGEKWEKGEAALSQVYMSGRICEEFVDTLIPQGERLREDHPPMAIAVLNDHHVLGKRVVYSVLRANNFNIKDYGVVTVDEAIKKVRADGIRVLLVSTLMLHSALEIQELVGGLKSATLDVKVIVGGAPFNFDSRLWQEVGADAMGRNAAEAIDIVRTFLGKL